MTMMAVNTYFEVMIHLRACGAGLDANIKHAKPFYCATGIVDNTIYIVSQKFDYFVVCFCSYFIVLQWNQLQIHFGFFAFSNWNRFFSIQSAPYFENSKFIERVRATMNSTIGSIKSWLFRANKRSDWIFREYRLYVYIFFFVRSSLEYSVRQNFYIDAIGYTQRTHARTYCIIIVWKFHFQLSQILFT